MNQKKIFNQPSPTYESFKDSLSSVSKTSTHSSSPKNINSITFNSVTEFGQSRSHLFDPLTNISHLSNKMRRKAVSWIMAVSWSNDYSSQCLWTAILLFYAYQSKNSIDKTKIHAILSICLRLSSKIYENNPMKAFQPKQDSSTLISNQELLEIQGQILKTVEFNLIFNNCLTSFLHSDYLQEEEMQKVLYICQLYLLKDYSIFFNKEKFTRVVSLVEDSRCNCDSQLTEIKELMQEKQSKIVDSKFSSKFDVQTYHGFFA